MRRAPGGRERRPVRTPQAGRRIAPAAPAAWGDRAATGWALALVLLLAAGAAGVAGQASGAAPDPPEPDPMTILTLDPGATAVGFSLGAVLHTVHGSFALERGTVRFDPGGGAASGEIVIDVASGDTGNDGRDRDMHQKVLHSDRHPRAVFTPERVEGALPASGTGELVLHGSFRLHGADHPLAIPAQVTRDGDRVRAEARFTIPYVAWGLDDPSTFILRVAKQVEVELDAAGTLSAP